MTSKAKRNFPIGDEDVKRTAEALVRNFGSKASAVCVETMRKMHARNDDAGADTWRRVLVVVRVLLPGKVPSAIRNSSQIDLPPN
jgi:hypothetical protein